MADRPEDRWADLRTHGSRSFRSGLSIAGSSTARSHFDVSNIAEGFSRRSEKEFSQYLFVAKASAAELQSHLYIASDRAYLTENDFCQIYDQLDHYARQVSNLITFLRKGLRTTA